MQAQLSLALDPDQPQTYRQRGTNVLQAIFKEHFQEFADTYEQKYAPTCGRFRLDRITEVVENFISCGDHILKVSPASSAPTLNVERNSSVPSVVKAFISALPVHRSERNSKALVHGE